jgi:phosphoglycerate dehydrogenase-like enzyme
VDRFYPLRELAAFMASADTVVAALPNTPQTAGLVDAAALAAMRPDAVIVNVGRGQVIDEAPLYTALSERRIGGAIIDVWYSYPASGQERGPPSRFPFHTLPNVTMTPHMSGWTTATRRRRQHTMADNVNRLSRGERLDSVVCRPSKRVVARNHVRTAS